MVEQYTNPYVDSSVFIGWIHEEVIDGVDRKRIADHIITRAENGDFLVHISALTLAEVHKKRGHEMKRYLISSGGNSLHSLK